MKEMLYQPGDWIGSRYEIQKVLCRSVNSYLYLAYRHDDKETVVLKTLSDEKQATIGMYEEFRRQVNTWILADRHPHVLEARWVENESARLFLELEYIEPDELGRVSLAEFLNSWNTHPVKISDYLVWAIQCCLGMEHLQMKGIRAHCDLKPQNLLIGRQGILKITDFGLASIAHPQYPWIERYVGCLKEEPKLTSPVFRTMTLSDGAFTAGTLGYIAPELFDGHSADDRSDIFSFGVVLWQLLTGSSTLPIEMSEISHCDIAHTWVQKYRQQYNDYVKALQDSIVPDNPLSQVVAKCLCTDPYGRFGNFPELQEALERLYIQETGSSFQAMESPPRSVIEHRRRGICLEFAGKYKEALDHYDQAIALDPACVSAWTNKAGVCVYGRDKMTKMDCLDKALSIDPHFVRALNNKGLEFSDQKIYEQAADCFDRAIENDPNYVSPLAHKGMILHLQKKYSEAHDCFNRAIALNPRDTRAVLSQSGLHAEEQNWQKALNNIDHVLAIDPLNITAWNRKLYFLKLLQKEDVASFCICRWSAGRRPHRPEDSPYYRPTDIPVNDKFVEVLSRNYKPDPKHYLDLGLSSYIAQDGFERTYYDFALIVDPRCTAAWLRKHKYYQDQNNFEQALFCAKMATLLERNNARAWEACGAAALGLQRYEDSLEYCRRALELDPNLEDAWYTQATAEFENKQYHEALTSYRQYLNKTSSGEEDEIAQARQRIGELKELLQCV